MQRNIDTESMTINLSEELTNGHVRGRESNGDRIETQEKRTRFSLSHDEGTLSFQIQIIPQHSSLYDTHSNETIRFSSLRRIHRQHLGQFGSRIRGSLEPQRRLLPGTRDRGPERQFVGHGLGECVWQRNAKHLGYIFLTQFCCLCLRKNSFRMYLIIQ